MIPTYYNVPRSAEETDEEFVSRLPGFAGPDRGDHYERGDGGTAACHDRAPGPSTLS
ncbi:hypothetical protein GCM10010129_74560 [Streptomyces fumigatiscleroticus]|nr:hypothetical protein GCM10010129_74560 [Streptomyces fumigatiscleroticus]